MNLNQKLTEQCALVATIDPQTVTSTEVFTDVIDFGAVQQAMAIASIGDMPSTTIDFKFYSCDSNGSNAAAVTGKATTQLAAHASNNDNKQLIIGVRDTDLLASGKQHGKFGLATGDTVGGAAAVDVIALPRQGAATDNDLSSVVQIV